MTSFININANYFYEIFNNKFLVYFQSHYIGYGNTKEEALEVAQKHNAQQEN